jgi:hypothetical protein
MFQDVARSMDSSHIEVFEEEAKQYLQLNLRHALPVLNIEIDAVTVTQQKLIGVGRHLETDSLQPQPQALMVTFQGELFSQKSTTN